MRAFILRRVELISQGLGDVIVIGSSHCAGTLRVKEFLTPQRPSLHLPRSRTRRRRPDHARPLSRHRRRHTGADMPRRGRAAPPDERADRGVPGVQRADRSGAGTGRRHRGRRPRRSRGRGLRRIRGARRAGARDDGPGRAGRLELEDRELPRLPDRHLRPGARRPRLHPGAEVRGPRVDRARRESPHLREASPMPSRRTMASG